MGPFCGTIIAQIFPKMHGLAYRIIRRNPIAGVNDPSRTHFQHGLLVVPTHGWKEAREDYKSPWEQQLWSFEEDSRRQKCMERKQHKKKERKCQNLLYTGQLKKKQSVWLQPEQTLQLYGKSKRYLKRRESQTTAEAISKMLPRH